ncbi:efflux RND transporter periplasmic adaptor subunit [Caldimonas thermodepolymerans]|uniref:Efflux transporter periplasmic adaptor subunit n=1 Tax=Caldimonas thermodepolymerans TaxID=215580 RepID=A0A2S5T7S5_9BURK|nr:efflux RND transporter periplasmic adaptor subunit [Caldimonas thermodepolymerans]PPE71054.1 efflux transporter periplasmic adaptor subunit [Caldimonas thermodepolymerans]QPC31356.1 efflux RND transporter periplasmic adaptor subunit [Caldimonas thermodepolymerans]RDH99678.1 multidrug efflux system membrane fusion protein [Caldimonas thermodepolymerans]TCP07596.1 multidrug efflux system membrane fusion protein [Caldimonas thermodepolymerans]UZG44100.1 efflux RND transporter periplasmic adapt
MHKKTLRTRPGLLAAAALLTLAAAVPAILFGSGRTQAEPVPASAEPAAVPAPVATVTQSEVMAWDEFSGRLEAVERVELRARVAGTVQAVHFREGGLVRRSDLLFTIDPAPYAAEVERAQAQVAAAQARLTHAQNEQVRAQRLWEENAIARRELDERENALREAQAHLRAAEAALRSAQLNLGYTQVRAPIDGRIGRVEVTVGNQVAAGPGAPVLTTIVSVHPIYASFDADERVVARALQQLGAAGALASIERIPVQMGTIDSTGAFPYEGRLQLVDNQVRTGSGTVRVRAVFDNRDGRLMPGQFARLRMGQAQPMPALLVNERAVGTDQDKRFVMVVGPDDKAAYREVTLGPAVDGLRVVTRGLEPGERIVVSGLHRVRPGTRIAPQPVAMDAKPELQVRREAADAS